jgi:DDE superfamily endonuclease
VDKTEYRAMAAACSASPAQFWDVFDDAFGRIAGRFARVEPRRCARDLLLGLLSPIERKNSWTLAEHAGHTSPDRMQRLLRTAVWDDTAARADLRGLVVDTSTRSWLAAAAVRARRATSALLCRSRCRAVDCWTIGGCDPIPEDGTRGRRPAPATAARSQGHDCTPVCSKHPTFGLAHQHLEVGWGDAIDYRRGRTRSDSSVNDEMIQSAA